MEEKRGFKAFLCTGIGRIGMILVLYAVIFMLILLIYNVFGNSSYAFSIIVGICVIFGWKFLNKITSDIFLFLPVVGWLVYFFVKLLLSAMIGLFVTPFVISRAVVNAIQDGMTEGEE